jgi:hypothetical protein
MKVLTIASVLLFVFNVSNSECPDPIFLEPGNINVTISDNCIDLFRIDIGSTHDGTNVEGYSKVFNGNSYNAITQTLDIDIQMPGTVLFSGGEYSASGEINPAPFRPETFPNGPFVGKGSFYFSITGLTLKAKVLVLVNLITNRVDCKGLTLNEFHFNNATANFENFIPAGTLVDWVVWSKNFKTNFDEDLAAEKEEITWMLKAAIDNWLFDKSLAEVYEILTKHILPQPDGPCDPVTTTTVKTTTTMTTARTSTTGRPCTRSNQ